MVVVVSVAFIVVDVAVGGVLLLWRSGKLGGAAEALMGDFLCRSVLVVGAVRSSRASR